MTWHPGIPEEYRNQIVTGDARELAKQIPDASIDLIFTDPPYPKEYLWCYDWLGEFASRVLKPDGLLFAYCGLVWFDVVMNYLGKHMEYVWIANLSENGPVRHYHPKQVGNCWRPIAIYSNGRQQLNYLLDNMKSSGRSKKYHEWQQEKAAPRYYIDGLTEPEYSVVVDPFSGGGTFPAVCKMLNRNYIAFEIDPSVAEVSRQRVKNTQPPLPLNIERQSQLSL